MKIYSRYDVPVTPGIDFSDAVSLTQQQFRDDANINVIIERFNRTGILVDPSEVGSRVADFREHHDFSDYHELRTRVAEAEEMFFDLPSHIRERLNNDPSIMLDTLLDADKRQLAIELGFYSPDPSPNPSPDPSNNSPREGSESEKS